MPKANKTRRILTTSKKMKSFPILVKSSLMMTWKNLGLIKLRAR